MQTRLNLPLSASAQTQTPSSPTDQSNVQFRVALSLCCATQSARSSCARHRQTTTPNSITRLRAGDEQIELALAAHSIKEADSNYSLRAFVECVRLSTLSARAFVSLSVPLSFIFLCAAHLSRSKTQAQMRASERATTSGAADAAAKLVQRPLARRRANSDNNY